jgi:hypothetical protein
MRLLYAALVLASPIAALWYWFGGAFGGFRLFEKIPGKVKKWLRIYGILTLLSGGGAVAVLATKGCISIGAMASYASGAASGATVHATTRKLHDLGKMAPPPFKTLTRLRMDKAKRAADLKRFEKLKVRQLHSDARVAILQFPQPFLQQPQKRTRSGPFCHVTCMVHHGDVYDRETLPELCRANWIPPNTVEVPGWWPLTDEFEVTAGWPGPAVEGFHSYKLTWLDH